MFAVGYLTYRKDLKMDEELSFFEKYFPERYETLKRGLTDGVPVPGLPGGFKVYEKEAMIGIVLESSDQASPDADRPSVHMDGGRMFP